MKTITYDEFIENFGNEKYCIVTNENYETNVGSKKNIIKVKVNEGINTIETGCVNYKNGNLFKIINFNYFPELRIGNDNVVYIWEVNIVKDVKLQYNDLSQKTPIFNVKTIYLNKPINISNYIDIFSNWLNYDQIRFPCISYNLTEELYYKIINKYPLYIRFIKNPTFEQKKCAIQHNCKVNYISNFDEELCDIAISVNGFSLLYFSKIYPQFINVKRIILAINTYPSIINHPNIIKEFSEIENILEHALKCKGKLIIDIKKNYYDIYNKNKEKYIKIALSNYSNIITDNEIINDINFDYDLCKLSVSGKSENCNILEIIKINYPQFYNEELIYFALGNNGMYINAVDEPTTKMIMIAVGNEPKAIKYVKKHTFKVCISILKKDPYNIKYVNRYDLEDYEYEALCINALTQKTNESIKFMINPSENVKKIAVKMCSSNIKYCIEPSDELKCLAIKNSCKALKYIKNPTKEMYLCAIIEYKYGIIDVLKKYYDEEIEIDDELLNEFCQLAVDSHPNDRETIIKLFEKGI